MYLAVETKNIKTLLYDQSKTIWACDRVSTNQEQYEIVIVCQPIKNNLWLSTNQELYGTVTDCQPIN